MRLRKKLQSSQRYRVFMVSAKETQERGLVTLFSDGYDDQPFLKSSLRPTTLDKIATTPDCLLVSIYSMHEWLRPLERLNRENETPEKRPYLLRLMVERLRPAEKKCYTDE